MNSTPSDFEMTVPSSSRASYLTAEKEKKIKKLLDNTAQQGSETGDSQRQKKIEFRTKHFIQVLRIIPFLPFSNYVLQYSSILAYVLHTCPRQQFHIKLQSCIGGYSGRRSRLSISQFWGYCEKGILTFLHSFNTFIPSLDHLP